MLLPLRVLVPQRESAFQVLLLEGVEEFARGVTLGVIAEVIAEPGEDEQGKNCKENQVLAAAGRGLVVFFGIHQCHSALSIIESGGIEKVPGKPRFHHRDTESQRFVLLFLLSLWLRVSVVNGFTACA